MAKKHLHVLITERRMDKLRLYAAKKDKTVTAIIEELLDTLPEQSSETHIPHPKVSQSVITEKNQF